MNPVAVSLRLRNAGHTRHVPARGDYNGVPGYSVDSLGVWEHAADGAIVSPGPDARAWADTLTAAGYDVRVAADHLIVTERNGST